MKVEDMKGGYTTGSCATAGMKAGLLALLDKNIVDQVVIENPQGQYIEVPIKAVEVISDTEAKVTVMKDGGDDPDVTHGNDVETTVTLDDTGELRLYRLVSLTREKNLLTNRLKDTLIKLVFPTKDS